MSVLDSVTTLTTQQLPTLAQNLLQRVYLAHQFLSPWTQAQLATNGATAQPSPRPSPTLAQPIAQRFARNDALSRRHDRHLFRFAATPTPLPLAKSLFSAQVNSAAVDDVIEPQAITSVEPTLWSSLDADETTAALSERPPIGRSSITAEITERIRRATMGTAALQPPAIATTVASTIAPQPSFADDLAPAPPAAMETDLAQDELAQYNHSIAALIRERIQRAEAERFAPQPSIARVAAVQSPPAPPAQAPPTTASVAAMLREQIQRARAKHLTPQTAAPAGTDANQPGLQSVSPSLSGMAWSLPATTEETDDAPSVLPAADPFDFFPGSADPVLTEDLPPQVRRMRAYSRVDLVATGVNRSLSPAEPTPALAERTTPLPDIDDQVQLPSVAAPFAATNDTTDETLPTVQLPTVQRTMAHTNPVTSQPPLLSPLVAQSPTVATTTPFLAPADQPAIDPAETTEETSQTITTALMSTLPAAPATSSATLAAEHESSLSPTVGRTADRSAAPPTVSIESTAPMAPAPSDAPPTRSMAEATIQRQAATIKATANDKATSFTERNPKPVPENTGATATQEGHASSSGKVVADELVNMTEPSGRLSGQIQLSPVPPNVDAPPQLPAAPLPSVTSPSTPLALLAAPVTEPPGSPLDSSDWGHPLDSTPAEQAVDSSSVVVQSARLPTAAPAETSPLPTVQTGERNLTPVANNGEAIAVSSQTGVTAPTLPPAPLAVTQRMAQVQQVHRQTLRPVSFPISTQVSDRTIDSLSAGKESTAPLLRMSDTMPLVAPIDQRKAAVAADVITTRQPPAPIIMRRSHFAVSHVHTPSSADDDRSVDNPGETVVTSSLSALVGKPAIQRRINPALTALLPAAEPVIAGAAELITNHVTADRPQNRDESPDLDTLARQVYPLIKRMLAIERERHPFA